MPPTTAAGPLWATWAADFDPRNYGYKKLSLLVRALSDAVDMKTEQQRVYVRNRVG